MVLADDKRPSLLLSVVSIDVPIPHPSLFSFNLRIRLAVQLLYFVNCPFWLHSRFRSNRDFDSLLRMYLIRGLFASTFFLSFASVLANIHGNNPPLLF